MVVPGALFINMRCPPAGDSIIHIHHTEIDTESGLAGGIRHTRMQLSRRKQNNSARRNNDANLGIDLNRFNRLGKGSWVGFQKLRNMSRPMLLVPLIIIVTTGIILDRPIQYLG